MIAPARPPAPRITIERQPDNVLHVLVDGKPMVRVQALPSNVEVRAWNDGVMGMMRLGLPDRAIEVSCTDSASNVRLIGWLEHDEEPRVVVMNNQGEAIAAYRMDS